MPLKKQESLVQSGHWILNPSEVRCPVTTGVLHLWSQMLVDILIVDITAKCPIAFQAANILFQTALHDVKAPCEDESVHIFFINPKWIGVLFLRIQKEIS